MIFVLVALGSLLVGFIVGRAEGQRDVMKMWRDSDRQLAHALAEQPDLLETTRNLTLVQERCTELIQEVRSLRQKP